ncbi:uncharacterized protein [Henckelia pumila]|uniref:uncharacterized protein isoform X2 n=1 Tax=Henckelia pumila TaxID=405737 RepID=UPI003C6E676B
MAPPRNPNSKSRFDPNPSSLISLPESPIIGDDDFQYYPSSSISASKTKSLPPPLRSQNPTTIRTSKKLKKQHPEKENSFPFESDLDWGCGLDSIEPTLDLLDAKEVGNYLHNDASMESKLLIEHEEEENFFSEAEFLEEESTKLDVLLKLCGDIDERGIDNDGSYLGALEEDKLGELISCPICGADISGVSDDLRHAHTNECLDKMGDSNDVAVAGDDTRTHQCPGQVVDASPLKSTDKYVNVSPVVEWLRNLGLAKYEDIFVREEIGWDELQRLTEEELCIIGVSALGPRKKIIHALKELRYGSTKADEPTANVSKGVADETKPTTNKLITDYFSGPLSERKGRSVTCNGQTNVKKSQANPTRSRRSIQRKDCIRNGKEKDGPLWCRIPGTTFRVDAFKYLKRDCSHWFLTHFHLDHYQGLTKSFGHGIIYCSSITAKLVKQKIGISPDKIQVLPLNQKINIAGTDVTCFDANHCPGAIIILFEPPNGKPVLHTGDFRFGEEMTKLSFLQVCPIHTLILDTTYCDPQYDFPKQEAVIQFVIDSIQAEAFNPKTLFLIGSYTIGKERLFIEVARVLRKKIYVTSAKLRILECLDLPQEDMQWLTLNEQESHIHVVPMWSIASFKRLKHVSNQYMGRYSLIVSFSPTGWSFGKGKKSTGKRWQQGTIIRYEVPYSEHSSFTELREFVKLISPVDIIPSVNNHGRDSHNSMISHLLA